MENIYGKKRTKSRKERENDRGGRMEGENAEREEKQKRKGYYPR